MNVIEKARELGKEIQADERYIKYNETKLKNDNDQHLQQLIGEFNLKRVALNTEMSKPEKNQEKLNELDTVIKALYADIMGNKNMSDFTEAKDEMDKLLSQINMVITMSANGEDPETCPIEVSSCSGSCDSCSGCH